jgi:PTH1 family peptidyl-tRNA hydrolase
MVIVGLGNPGDEYKKTRHNVGWWVLDILRSRLSNLDLRIFCNSRVFELKPPFYDRKHLLVYPHTFMNNSGKAVKCLYEGDDLVVIHDDLDLPVGRARVRFGGSSGGHKGVESIIQSLGTQEFWRVKIGIGRPQLKEEVIDYVLSEPPRGEEELLINIADLVAQELIELLKERNFTYFQQKINSFKFDEPN